jgi:hypothetical protein
VVAVVVVLDIVMVRSRTREKWSIWYDVQTMTMQTPAHLVTGPDRLSMKNGTLLFCMAKTSAPSRFFMDSCKKPVFASHFNSRTPSTARRS